MHTHEVICSKWAVMVVIMIIEDDKRIESVKYGQHCWIAGSVNVN